jgi:hypothetical protein
MKFEYDFSKNKKFQVILRGSSCLLRDTSCNVFLKISKKNAFYFTKNTEETRRHTKKILIIHYFLTLQLAELLLRLP